MDKNLFFEMDNLDALYLLRKTHLNKVKMIYIDPPYNTRKKQSYHDKRTHDEWKSFMYPRLYLARDLLREDGVIFISIDDNEQHHLRMICDEIFGDGNFVASFPRLSKKSGKSAENVSKNNDYVLVYGKTSYSSLINTAHAVMKLNAEDGGNRKWIMVQIPEPCDEKSEAFKAGYKTIADIGKERIRRAAKQLGVECDFEVILPGTQPNA